MTIFANNVAGTMAANIGPSDTQILLGAGQGSRFPSPAGGEYFYATLVHITSGLVEVVQCTARSVDTLTVVRGRDSTTAISFTTGSVVEMRLAAVMLRELDYRTVKGVANGLASLDAGTTVPDAQIPAGILRAATAAATYVPLTQRGANNGVATLDGSGDVPDAQIPAGILRVATAAATYIPLTQRAAANGVATLDGTTKIPVAQIPDLSATYLTKTNPAVTGTLTTTSTITAGGAITSSQSFASSSAAVVLGPVGVGTVYFRPNGVGSATNEATIASTGMLTAVNMTATSDRRKKKLIRKEVARPFLVDALQLKSWLMRSDSSPGRGVVAQDLLPHAPEYVHDAAGVLSVDKAGLALEAVIGLASRVREIEKVLRARRPNH